MTGGIFGGDFDDLTTVDTETSGSSSLEVATTFFIRSVTFEPFAMFVNVQSSAISVKCDENRNPPPTHDTRRIVTW